MVHQGPVGDEYGAWFETNFNSEYWQEDHQSLSRPQTMIDFLDNLRGSARWIKRDALRTLRGRILLVPSFTHWIIILNYKIVPVHC